jgi:HEAT repeat protein
LKPETEPSYGGKPLHVWLAVYDPKIRFQITWGDLQEANHAIHSMGPPAIPALLRRQWANDPPWKLKLLTLLSKQRYFKIHHVPADVLNSLAAKAFTALGTNGEAAVPQLMAIYRRDFSEVSRQSAAISLEGIGPPAAPAVPLLASSLTNSTGDMRLILMQALGAIRGDPKYSVPALASTLDNPDWIIRHYAALELGRFGKSATAAVPGLIKNLQDTNAIVRQYSTNALLKIDPAAAAKAGVK